LLVAVEESALLIQSAWSWSSLSAEACNTVDPISWLSDASVLLSFNYPKHQLYSIQVVYVNVLNNIDECVQILLQESNVPLCHTLTSFLITGIQTGEKSRLGWLMCWFLIFPVLAVGIYLKKFPHC